MDRRTRLLLVVPAGSAASAMLLAVFIFGHATGTQSMFIQPWSVLGSSIALILLLAILQWRGRKWKFYGASWAVLFAYSAMTSALSWPAHEHVLAPLCTLFAAWTGFWLFKEMKRFESLASGSPDSTSRKQSKPL
jgi:hypothetical protein